MVNNGITIAIGLCPLVMGNDGNIGANHGKRMVHNGNSGVFINKGKPRIRWFSSWTIPSINGRFRGTQESDEESRCAHEAHDSNPVINEALRSTPSSGSRPCSTLCDTCGDVTGVGGITATPGVVGC